MIIKEPIAIVHLQPEGISSGGINQPSSDFSKATVIHTSEGIWHDIINLRVLIQIPVWARTSASPNSPAISNTSEVHLPFPACSVVVKKLLHPVPEIAAFQGGVKYISPLLPHYRGKHF